MQRLDRLIQQAERTVRVYRLEHFLARHGIGCHGHLDRSLRPSNGNLGGPILVEVCQGVGHLHELT